MPKIKDANRNCIAVLEDPRTARSQMYFYGDAVTKSSLSPVFGKHAHFSSTSGDYTQNHGRTDIGDFDNWVGDGRGLALNKETASMNWSTDTGDVVSNNIPPGNFASMDPDKKWSGSQLHSEGSTSMVLLNSPGVGPGSYENRWWSNLNSSTELSEIAITGSDSSNTHNTGYHNNQNLPGPIYHKMAGENYLSGVGHNYGGGVMGFNGSTYRFSRLIRATYPNWTATDFGTRRDYCFFQFLGPSTVDERPLYLLTDYRNDKTHYIVRHNVDTNSETVLHTFNTAVSSTGNNQGGDRATGTGLDEQHKASSTIEDDPSSSGNKAWYTPYFDTNNNYFPFYFQWNKTNDTFTRNADVTVSGTLSSTHLNSCHGVRGSTAAFNSVMYNERHDHNSVKYITVFPLEGVYQGNDTGTGGRTMVTYSISSSDPKALTFHSAETADVTIKNVVFLNDNKTLLGVFHHGKFCVYSFNATNGWEKTATIPHSLVTVGRDASDRIYGVADEGGTYATLHLITATVPVTVTITPASTTYDYSGSNINSTVAVSAYGIGGTRIATTVNLTISGDTMEFSGSAKTTSVTTSTTQDTNVNIVVTGAGISEILANIDI